MQDKPIIIKEPPPVTKWWHRLPIIGCDKWTRLEADYHDQLINRTFTYDPWIGRDCNPIVRDSVIKIILGHWNGVRHLHPEDRYAVIGMLQTGDLTEIEIIHDLQKISKERFDDIHFRIMGTGLLIDVIKMIECGTVNDVQKLSAQQVDSAEASTIAVPPSGPSGSPR